MEAQRQAVIFLRSAILLLVLVYAFTLHLEWMPVALSSEANQYQQIVFTTMSGFSLDFALQKVCWLLGNSLGILGAILLFFRSGYGLPAVLLSAPLLGLAAVFGAPPAAYPGIEGTSQFLFWCLSSAVWAGVTVYAFAERRVLFAKQRAENQLAPKR